MPTAAELLAAQQAPAPAGTPPAGTPPAGTPPAGTPPAGTPPAGTPPADNVPKWLAGLDADTQAWARNRKLDGITDPDQLIATAVVGHRNAEKLIGVPQEQLIKVPKGDDEFRAVALKLGMPAEPTGYELSPVPEGGDKAFDEWARKTFHAAGVTAAQAKALDAAFQGFNAQQAARIAETQELAHTQQAAALKLEWGAAHDGNIRAAAGVMKALDMSAEAVDALQGKLGFDGVMKYLHGLATKIGRPAFVKSDDQNGGTVLLSPAQAKAELAAFIVNADNVTAMTDKKHPDHAKVLAQRRRLSALAIGVNPDA